MFVRNAVRLMSSSALTRWDNLYRASVHLPIALLMRWTPFFQVWSFSEHRPLGHREYRGARTVSLGADADMMKRIPESAISQHLAILQEYSGIILRP
jgi:hypothetical protein